MTRERTGRVLHWLTAISDICAKMSEMNGCTISIRSEDDGSLFVSYGEYVVQRIGEGKIYCRHIRTGEQITVPEWEVKDD